MNKERNMQILSLGMKGFRPKYIAQQVNLSEVWVGQILSSFGLNGKERTLIRRREILRLWEEEGMTPKEIADLYDLSINYTRAIITSQGGKLNLQSRQRIRNLHERFDRLDKATLAKANGVSLATVIRAIGTHKLIGSKAICQNCGKQYKVSSYSQKYCSKECRIAKGNSRRKFSFVCGYCGKKMVGDRKKGKNNNFCSYDHYQKLKAWQNNSRNNNIIRRARAGELFDTIAEDYGLSVKRCRDIARKNITRVELPPAIAMKRTGSIRSRTNALLYEKKGKNQINIEGS